MREKEAGTDEARRDFLKLASIAVPAAAATSVAGTAATASEQDGESGGLRKTKHVKAYLESARF
ncbi:MAG: twin-arginine translocation pathway signal protein [Paracoccaceae bacterium]